MTNKKFLRQFEHVQDDIEAEINQVFALGKDWLPEASQNFGDNQIVSGRVRKVTSDSVWVDIGFKSEGIVDLREWYDDATDQIVPPEPGENLDVLVLAGEDSTGTVTLSFRKARWQKAWETVVSTKKPGDVVSGAVVRKIKGGVLVNIGVNVFLPASQIDVRRFPDLGELLGKTVECKIVSIDSDRRNVVVSRRQLIEDRNIELRATLLAEIEPGQTRKGVVKNIASFGAFVDLGGIDGLLHVTDMAWSRVNHPSDVVQVNSTLDVFIIKVDRAAEKISVGLKQLTPSPWTGVEDRFPIGSQHKASVVTLMEYGAFVALEPGLEGLVHISEMSWTRRIGHPSEVLEMGATVAVQVLAVNSNKREISLGIKQTLENPWSHVQEKYPAGTRVECTVRNMANYGAFAEIEAGVDGLVHLTDFSWVRKISHPKEMLTIGDKVHCVVLEVDTERRRISLGMKQVTEDPWAADIPARYPPGARRSGSVTKVTNFGLFVELEKGLEGLMHISEVSGGPPLHVGDPIDVFILRLENDERKIALGLAPATKGTEEATADGAAIAAPAERARASERLRGGLAGDQAVVLRAVAPPVNVATD